MLRSLARTEQALSLSTNFINLFRSREINRNQHTTSEDLISNSSILLDMLLHSFQSLIVLPFCMTIQADHSKQ